MSERNKKRTIFDFNSNLPEPPQKKQKVDSKLKTKFVDSLDQQQFEALFQTIQSTSSINNLNIPICIVSDIAQYATGYLINCNNKICCNEIVRLHCDDNIPTHEMKYYRQCNNNGYYCSECMIYTTKCECGEWTFTADAHCNICNSPTNPCQNWDCTVSFDFDILTCCPECNQNICEKCAVSCDECDKFICTNCFDKHKNGKYTLDKCKKCGNYIGQQHKNCINKAAYSDSELSTIFNFTRCKISECQETFCAKCEHDKNNQCPSCDYYFCDTHCSFSNKENQCNECTKNVCGITLDCQYWCEDCQYIVCKKCFDARKSGKYVLTECQKCDNTINTFHKHCNQDWIWGERRPIKLDFEYCAENDCKVLICSKCEKNKNNKCIQCKTISYFCSKHDAQNNNWTCLWCYF